MLLFLLDVPIPHCACPTILFVLIPLSLPWFLATLLRNDKEIDAHSCVAIWKRPSVTSLVVGSSDGRPLMDNRPTKRLCIVHRPTCSYPFASIISFVSLLRENPLISLFHSLFIFIDNMHVPGVWNRWPRSLHQVSKGSHSFALSKYLIAIDTIPWPTSSRVRAAPFHWSRWLFRLESDLFRNFSVVINGTVWHLKTDEKAKGLVLEGIRIRFFEVGAYDLYRALVWLGVSAALVWHLSSEMSPLVWHDSGACVPFHFIFHRVAQRVGLIPAWITNFDHEVIQQTVAWLIDVRM